MNLIAWNVLQGRLIYLKVNHICTLIEIENNYSSWSIIQWMPALQQLVLRSVAEVLEFQLKGNKYLQVPAVHRSWLLPHLVSTARRRCGQVSLHYHFTFEACLQCGFIALMWQQIVSSAMCFLCLVKLSHIATPEECEARSLSTDLFVLRWNGIPSESNIST